MTLTVLPRLTPCREAWLRQLEAEPGSSRPRGRIGYDCMQLGWTEWLYRFETRLLGEAEAKQRFGPEIWPPHTMVGETLTEKGRAMLTEEEKQ